MALHHLHPALQDAIRHQLRWTSLRPVQDEAITTLGAGANAIILAPTAGGKTEAALFPVLSRVLSEALAPVAALYVCPLRALLNNQEARLQGYARMVGLDVFKWHGDVSEAKRRGFQRAPAHVLLTTPESLEVMLMSARVDAAALFAGLSAVIIDEVHAFAGDDRGAHLASLLERLRGLARRDVQRIGLSATVGNPRDLARWLQGSSRRASVVVDPPRPAPQRALKVHHSPALDDVARGVAREARGKKSLVFVESRATAEQAAHALAGRGVEVFIHHSAVSREDRLQAEERFAAGRNTAIVATSTLELGIDVGDLDQVVQVDAPASVAAFLQRLGRTGRRAGSTARCTFFCQTEESVLRAVALVRLAQAGWVEDVRPPAEAMHVLAHQVLGMVLSPPRHPPHPPPLPRGGEERSRVGRRRSPTERGWSAAEDSPRRSDHEQGRGEGRRSLFKTIRRAAPFSTITPARFDRLLDTMLTRRLLHEADGKLSLGGEGERLYGRKNYFELCAVFSAPAAVRVVAGREEVGFLPASFLSVHEERGEPLCFRLSGRAWELQQVDFAKGVALVQRARAGRLPSWLGLPGTLSRAVCEAMRDVLVRPGDEAAWLTKAAAGALAELRAAYGPLLEEGPAPLEALEEGGVQWHTFAGGAVNRLLAAGLQEKTGSPWVAGNLGVRGRGVTLTEAARAVRGLKRVKWQAVAEALAPRLARGVVSKFQPCLPEEEETRLLVGRLLDVEGTKAFVRTPPLPARAGRGSG